jgi:hypothetical protein
MASIIGTDPNQVPTNADLGTMAYQDYDVVAPQFLAGRRNLIINGAMQVAQRGTSDTVDGWTNYFIDRFNCSFRTSTGTAAGSQSTDAPAEFYNSLKLTQSSVTTEASSDIYQITQRIEANNFYQCGFGTSDATSFTLSFWVKSSVTGTYSVSFSNGYVNSTYRNYVAEYTINSANTWERKTITVSGDTNVNWNRTGNGRGLDINWDLGSGSDYQTTARTWQTANYTASSNQTRWIENSGATFYITGVQLEVGSVATPFEHRSYGEELALCQRYYYQTPSGSASTQKIYWEGYSEAGSFAHLDIFFPTEMRAAPSCTVSGTFDLSGMAANPEVHTVFPNRVRVQSAVTGTAGRKYYSQNGGTGLIADAEL